MRAPAVLVAIAVAAIAASATDARADRVVTGTVLDDATGKPVPGALVAVGTGEAGTDDQGRFAIGDAPFGRLDVLVIADGYRALFGSARVGEDVTLRLVPEPRGGEVL